jgi:hypothetical protein
VSTIALDVRVNTCIPRFCGISVNAPDLSKRPTCSTGREYCDWQVSASVMAQRLCIVTTARLRENGAVHGWANGGADGKSGCRGRTMESCGDTGRCSGTGARGHSTAMAARRQHASDWPCRPWVRAGHRETVQPPRLPLWAALSLSLRVVAAAAERDTEECAAHAAHDAVAAVLPVALRAPVRRRRRIPQRSRTAKPARCF